MDTSTGIILFAVVAKLHVVLPVFVSVGGVRSGSVLVIRVWTSGAVLCGGCLLDNNTPTAVFNNRTTSRHSS